MSETMTLERVGDTQIVCRRRFRASPQRVFDAHWQPALLKQWMLGPDGWTMPVCEARPEPGAQLRFRWANEEGEEFGIDGEVLEVDPPHRSVHTEHFDFPGATPTTVETLYRADGDGTLLVVTVTYASKEAREDHLREGVAEGMATSYDRLDAL
jgi:uncharacterized protein YndB with AHSA1/START domain